MMNNLIFILTLIFINILIFKFLIKTFVKLKIYDSPDFLRKIHSTNVPLAGGAIFIINIFFYLILKIFLDDDTLFFDGLRELFSFLIGSISIFLIGLYDDRYSLKPNTKLILLSIIVTMSVSISDTFQINHLSFLFHDKIVYLKNFGIIFTIFCFLVFLNAFNMFDGINGLSVTYFLICIIYLILLNHNFYFFSFLLIPALIFLYFNFQNKVFLGDSGSLLLGFILSCLFIKSYNEKLLYADQIVLLMIIPGIDMLRVAYVRIIHKKHPFHADQSHLHHLILKKYNTKTAYFIIISFVIFTAIISQLVMNRFVNLIQIILILLIYFSFISLHKLK